MSSKVLRLEITDICDELSEDLRRELIERQVICVSKVDSNRKQFYKLKDEIKRLKSDLKFANKCLITFNEFKRYLNQIRPQIEIVLDFRQKQDLNALETKYQIMMKSLKERTQTNTSSGSDSVINEEINVNNGIECDHNYNINGEITETNDYLNANSETNHTNNEDITDSDSEAKDFADDFVEEIDENPENQESNRRPKVGNKKRVHFSKSLEKIREFQTKSHESSKGHQNCNKRLKTSTPEEEVGFSCPIKGCDWTTSTKGNVNRHLIYSKAHLKLQFDSSLKFKCKDCTFRCDSQKWFDLHKSVHSDERFECELCGKLYVQKSDITRHMRQTHRHSHELKCSVEGCHLTFSSDSLRSFHLKQDHNIVQTYSCDYPDCDFVSRAEPDLEDHKYQHTKEKPYVCHYVGCEYSGSNRKEFFWHKYKHERSRPPNTCDLCGKVFKHPCRLKAHQLAKHFDEKPFECDLCEKSFYFDENLKNHKTEQHSSLTPVTPGSSLHRNKLMCTYAECNQMFESVYLRYKHIQMVHSKKLRCVWPRIRPRIQPQTHNITVGKRNVTHGLRHTGEGLCTPPACSVNQVKKTAPSEKELNSPEATKSNQLSVPYVKDSINGKTIPSIPSTQEIIFENEFINEVEVIDETQVRESEATKPEIFIEDNDNEIVDPNEEQITSVNNIEFVDEVYDENVSKPVFKCDEIDCIFETHSQYLMDIHNNVHKRNESFVCLHCNGKAFKTADQLRNHHYYNHRRGTVKCLFPQCGQTPKELIKHMIKHLKDLNIEVFRCQTNGCEYETKNYNHMNRHELKGNHTKMRTNLFCPLDDCGQVFSSREQLNKHSLDHKNANLNYDCNLCDTQYKTYSQLKSHLTKHSTDRPFICQYCSKTFKTRGTANQHISLLHTKVKKYSCPYEGCDRKFITGTQKCKHIMIDHKKIKKRYPCDWPDCGVTCGTNFSLQEHKRIHTGEMPHVCNWPECGKSFRHWSSFDTHMRLHTNDRRYTCDWPGCDFTHTDRGARRMHRLRHQTDLERNSKKLIVKINNNKNIKTKPEIKTKPKRKIVKPKRYDSESDDSQYSDSSN